MKNLGWVTPTWYWAQEGNAVAHQGPLREWVPFQPLLPDYCDSAVFSPLPSLELGDEAMLTWLSRNIEVYVINLAKDTERFGLIKERLNQLQISFRRIDGVDMSSGVTLDMLKEEGLVLESFDMSAAQKEANRPEQGVGGIRGTVGCASAHFRTYAAIGKQQKPLALVFEDDAWPADDFVQRLRALVTNELPCGWEALQLRSINAYGACISSHIARTLPDGNEPDSVCRHGVSISFAGMLYRRDAMPHIVSTLMQRVWNSSAPWCMDIDTAMASASMSVEYYSVPAFQKPELITIRDLSSQRLLANGYDSGPLMESLFFWSHQVDWLHVVAACCLLLGLVWCALKRRRGARGAPLMEESAME